MASYRYIDDFSIGDTYTLVRILDSTPGNYPVTDAYWTVKPTLTTLDSDAVLAYHITTVPSITGGVVVNNADGSVDIQFVASPNDSSSMISNTTYFYDIQVSLQSGDKYSLETGKLFTQMNVTFSH